MLSVDWQIGCFHPYIPAGYLESRTAFYENKFEVLTAVTKKSNIFWEITPCVLVDVYKRCRQRYCFRLQGRIEAKQAIAKKERAI
jgi:hypothetical protein